jgi:hypothetical protein
VPNPMYMPSPQYMAMSNRERYASVMLDGGLSDNDAISAMNGMAARPAYMTAAFARGASMGGVRPGAGYLHVGDDADRRESAYAKEPRASRGYLQVGADDFGEHEAMYGFASSAANGGAQTRGSKARARDNDDDELPTYDMSSAGPGQTGPRDSDAGSDFDGEDNDMYDISTRQQMEAAGIRGGSSAGRRPRPDPAAYALSAAGRGSPSEAMYSLSAAGGTHGRLGDPAAEAMYSLSAAGGAHGRLGDPAAEAMYSLSAAGGAPGPEPAVYSLSAAGGAPGPEPAVHALTSSSGPAPGQAFGFPGLAEDE